MNATPAISLIFINYNGRKHLKYCLPSLLKTNYPQEKLEIIVVDNNSQDSSVPFVRENFAQARVIETANEGYGAGINKGLAKSRGDYIAALNIDLKFHPDWLIHLLEPFKEDKTVGITGPQLLPFATQETQQGSRPPAELKIPCFSKYGYPYHYKIKMKKTKKDPAQGPSPKPLETIWVPGAAMLIKREVFTKIGGFDPIYFLYYEDFDFCFRARMAGYKILLVPASLIYHQGSALIDPAYTATEKVFLTAQNSLITFIKNYSLQSLILYGPIFLGLRTADILNDLLRPHHRHFAWAKIKALWSAIRKIGTIKKKRREVQKIRLTSDKEIFKFNRRESLLKNIKQKILNANP
ncbi:hypothetical protein B5M47_00245 [candidate division CPR3 bacterium 4484_211]|uniref:Glycosyltransferase 2-like domain-containing protein n=1 Tax=candidate division CPR3 bacterium 4484_211 TaxID=1968527 RepID=A0A1W9NZG3_UNCC3|nr:MAG: hypothetical protein B5M47_00245 [candidate division CPR3 bacterium 4484_211]